MRGHPKPLEIVVYQDVLCAWCYVAELRLEIVRKELGELVRWRHRPYPLWPGVAVPSSKSRKELAREIRRAKREPEGKRLSCELWLGEDPPQSSLSALCALEAARLQGPEARALLFRSMQRAALEVGMNVDRPDVTYELATRVGLEMNRFVPAWQSEGTANLVREEHRVARQRGVKGVPTLVIGGKWMLSGLREVREYREQILACLGRTPHNADPSGERTLH